MNPTNYSQEEKLGFRQIVLTHLKKIMDLTLVGASVGRYKGAVQSLSDVLLPFYDEKMHKEYKTFDENFTKLIAKCEKICESEVANIYPPRARKYSRKLFRELNLLLSRVDYLKSEVYGEDKDEEVHEE